MKLKENRMFLAKKEMIDKAIDKNLLIKLLLFLIEFGAELLDYIKERRAEKKENTK